MRECKDCKKAYQKSYISRKSKEDPEWLIRRLDQAREFSRKHLALRSPKSNKRRPRDPLKTKAQATLRKAVLNGSIKPLPCEVCGSSQKVHGHHEDYNRPLDVNWLCQKHHHLRHMDLKRDSIRKLSTSTYEHSSFIPLPTG
jgi:hypothetical protein